MPDSHILLLPKQDYFAWVKAVKDYALKYGVNLTGDPASAAKNQIVTVVNPPHGFDTDIVAWFQQNAPAVRLDVVAVNTPDELTQAMAARAQADDRFGEKTAQAPADGLEPPPDRKINLPSNASDADKKVADIWNKYGGLMQTLADQLQIDPGVAVAVFLTESGGRMFAGDGRMIIRFENHVFWSRWGQNNAERFNQHFRYNAEKKWTGHQWRPPGADWKDFHGNQNSEWEVLNFASTLDETAAKSSISMGGPQIMGFNFAQLGYKSALEMFDSFATSERGQISGFFNFVKSPKRLATLQAGDFTAFASGYNGPGQAEMYSGLIRTRFEAFKKLRTW